jgi:hypothetical protein
MMISQDTGVLWFVMEPTEIYTANETQPVNNPPIVEGITYTNTDNYYEFKVNAYDPDGDELEYYWYVDGKAVENESDSPILDVELSNGTHEVKVVVSDGSANATASISVSLNQPPEIVSTPDSLNLLKGREKKVNIILADDRTEVSQLEFDAVVVDGFDNVSIVGKDFVDGKWILTVKGMKEGDALIRLYVTDADGETVSKDINVKVFDVEPPQNPEVGKSVLPPEVPVKNEIDNQFQSE